MLMQKNLRINILVFKGGCSRQMLLSKRIWLVYVDVMCKKHR
jgi:hypothetical protein